MLQSLLTDSKTIIDLHNELKIFIRDIHAFLADCDIPSFKKVNSSNLFNIND